MKNVKNIFNRNKHNNSAKPDCVSVVEVTGNYQDGHLPPELKAVMIQLGGSLLRMARNNGVIQHSIFPLLVGLKTVKDGLVSGINFRPSEGSSLDSADSINAPKEQDSNDKLTNFSTNCPANKEERCAGCLEDLKDYSNHFTARSKTGSMDAMVKAMMDSFFKHRA